MCTYCPKLKIFWKTHFRVMATNNLAELEDWSKIYSALYKTFSHSRGRLLFLKFI